MSNIPLYGAGAKNVSPPLTGSELIDIDTGGAVKARTTTSAIAALATNFSNDSPQAVTAVVGTTLTAAQLLAGLINRSGPTANFTDTTDTAANLAAAIGSSTYPVSFYVDIKNTTPFWETLSAGVGVTMSATAIVAPNSINEYLVVLASATAATFNHVITAPLSVNTLMVTTALSTVGAGVVTGAGIAGTITVRGGAQANAAFTDTTDTAVAIIAAQPNARVGASWIWSYQNTTNANATLAGGVGVTLSGITLVPANTSATFLVTYTAAGAVSIVGYGQTQPSAPNGTFVANGATAVVVADTRITANSVVCFGLKTIGGTPAGAPFLSAVTAGTGFSVKAAAGDTSTYNYTILN